MRRKEACPVAVKTEQRTAGGVAYTLTIKPHKVDVEGGQFDLEITVDDGVTEENITVTIPGDYI